MNITKLKKIDPNSPELKHLISKNKGIYFWFEKGTDALMYIGTGSGKQGLYGRIISQHMRATYIEYRSNKGRNAIRDAYQLKHPIIRERDGAIGIDQSSFRRSVGSQFNIKPGQGTVNFIKENFYLSYIELEDKEKLMLLEKQLISDLNPLLNIDHKNKLSNRMF
jgi:hypothetical protein